jgi:hypothetical protein
MAPGPEERVVGCPVAGHVAGEPLRFHGPTARSVRECAFEKYPVCVRPGPGCRSPGLLLEPPEPFCHPRKQIIHLRQLDLKFTFPGSSALGEDIQNEAGAVNDFGGDQLLEIFLLAGRQLIVKHHSGRFFEPNQIGNFGGFSLADQQGRVRSNPFLRHHRNRLAAGGFQQPFQFVHRRQIRRIGRALQLDPHHNGSFHAPILPNLENERKTLFLRTGPT